MTGSAVLLACALLAAPAMAQQIGQAPDQAGRRSTDRVVLGVGVIHAPAYQGSDEYRTLPLPAIDIAHGPFFANFRNGIGLNAVDSPDFTIGGSVTFMPGYRRRDVPEGIGRLSAGVGGRLFTSFKSGGIVATLGGTRGIAGSTKGFIADASLSYPIMASRQIILIPTVSTTWANRRHNDRYFGIGAQEAAASGLPQFRGKAGFKDVSALMTVNYRLNRRLNLSVSGGVTTLMGNVKDSPLAINRTQPMGLVSLSVPLGR